MNLELLDPFGRQIPDRVDSTLSLPRTVWQGESSSSSTTTTPPQQNVTEEEEEQRSVYHVAFNRRGAYIAVGHGKGTVAVHDFTSRTLSALYKVDPVPKEKPPEKLLPPAPPLTPEATKPPPPLSFPFGVTSLTWSRRSRTLLAGAVGDAQVRLFDTTHPLGPEDCCPVLTEDTLGGENSTTGNVGESPIPSSHGENTGSSRENSDLVRQPRILDQVKEIEISQDAGSSTVVIPTLQERHEAALKKMRQDEQKKMNAGKNMSAPPQTTKRYATLLWSFPEPLGGSLQVHPRNKTAGLAVLESGALVVFRVPPTAWESYPLLETMPVVKTVTMYKSKHVTCAAFDAHGESIYVATKDGIILGFSVTAIFQALEHAVPRLEPIVPKFEIVIPGNSHVWHLVVSKNAKLLLLNCADSALRLYNTADLWSCKEETLKPSLVFQDVVSKLPFVSCDFSGDAEHVCGAVNNVNDKYELYLWNTTTGALMDQLTGPPVSLYSVAWHPTRSFIAVGTMDGLVDIWGPRMDWTAFAPDFTALPMNVEYVEREDEFDLENEEIPTSLHVEDSDETVNVVKVEPVPVFASDSESESDVFYFETRVKNIMSSRGRPNAWMAGKGASEEKD